MGFDLVGSVAKERELTGDESLTQLVEIFTDKKAVLTAETLPGMGKPDRDFVSQRQRKIRKAIQNLMRDLPLDSQKKPMEEALDSLAGEYVCSEFGLKYDGIDSRLFRLKKKVGYVLGNDRYPKKRNIFVPLFVSVAFGDDIWQLETVRDDEQIKHNVDISARAPPITKKVKEKAREAEADYMAICSKALRTKSIGDVLLRDWESGRADLGLHIAWIPSELEIKTEVIDRDPLLVARIYDKDFLVSKWDVQGEEPYQHYLAEFLEETSME